MLAPELGAAPRARRRFGVGFVLAVVWLAVVAVAALTADLLPLPPYAETLTGPPMSGPGPRHVLGTDGLGRDMLSRVVHGSRVSLGIGLGAGVIGLLGGGLLGLIAGYRGRAVDTVVMAGTDIALAFPPLVLALAVVAFAGSGFRNVLLVLGVLSIPAWARLVRGTTMAFAGREFVLAAKAIGARERAIVWREIVPNVALPAASFMFVSMAVLVVAEGSLAFLGLSVPAPTPTWGALINDGRASLDLAPHIALIPAAVMFLTVLAFNVAGDRMRELADVRATGLEPARTPARSGTDDPACGGQPRGTAFDPGASAPLLTVADLRTRFPTPHGEVRAVDGVSFDLERGHTLAVVGESGSGKTMLIRTILGLTPDGARREGRVYLDGVDLTAEGPQGMRRVLGTRMATVFQDPMTALNPVRKIGTQVAEPLQVHRGMRRKDALAAAERLLASVNVPEPARVLRCYPQQLSGGMRQRVTIAMALSCDPELLFADEPTTALDVTVQHQVLRLLKRQREQRDMALVLVSHDLAMVGEWADEIMVMYAGRVVERGPAQDVLRHPRMPYTGALVQAGPLLDSAVHSTLPVIEGRPPDLTRPPVGCRFHPRCPRARERCSSEEPELVRSNTPAHSYACWYPVDGVNEDPRPDRTGANVSAGPAEGEHDGR